MSKLIALDTNILVYSIDQIDSEKKIISENLISENPFIASQTVSEFINVSKRLLKRPKLEILSRCNVVLDECIIIPFSRTILHKAEILIKTHDFQLFDAIIVASALAANCDLMYSEDMHHNLMIENQLRIINPFI